LFKEQRERGREERPTRPARLHRPGGGEQQRDGEGRGVDVPHVDPLQRRARQVEQREGGGRPLVAEADAGQAEHRGTAQGERGRLRDQQHHRPGDDPEGGHEGVHDRGEMVAPRVHLGHAHVGPGPAREVPPELHVVAQVERVGREREVAGHGHEREQERVGGHADRDHPSRAPRRQGAQREPDAQGHEAQGQQKEVLGPPRPVLAPAGPQHEGAAEGRRRQHGRDGEEAGDHR